MSIATILLASAAGLCAAAGCYLISTVCFALTKKNRSAVLNQAKRLAQHPGEVTASDIETELCCRGLSASDVRLISSRARALGMNPLTMWISIQTYGAREVAVAVAGELPHEALVEHLTAGTAPDFGELEVFAALNGLEAAAGSSGRVYAGSARKAPAAMDRSQVIMRRALADVDSYVPGAWSDGARAA